MSSSVTSFKVGTVVTAAAVVAGTVAVWRYLSSRSTGKENSRRPVEVSQLWLFPVKSCSGTPQASLRVTPMGVEYDREWCVFRRSDNKFVSQRECPKLKLLCASIVEMESSVQASMFLRIARIADAVSCEETKGFTPLLVPIRSSAEMEALAANDAVTIPVNIWDLCGRVVDEGAEAAAWLSEYIGEDVYLGRSVQPRRPADAGRHAPFIPNSGRSIRLQDFSPLHLCTEEGLAHLRRTVGDPTINANRFRPNIVVSGVPFPQEDMWEYFTIGANVSLKSVKLTTRCSMPTIGDAAQRDPKYMPTAYLKAERSVGERGGTPKPCFGLSVFLDSKDNFETVQIRLGDRVAVTGHIDQPRKYEGSR